MVQSLDWKGQSAAPRLKTSHERTPNQEHEPIGVLVIRQRLHRARHTSL